MRKIGLIGSFYHGYLLKNKYKISKLLNQFSMGVGSRDISSLNEICEPSLASYISNNNVPSFNLVEPLHFILTGHILTNGLNVYRQYNLPVSSYELVKVGSTHFYVPKQIVMYMTPGKNVIENEYTERAMHKASNKLSLILIKQMLHREYKMLPKEQRLNKTSEEYINESLPKVDLYETLKHTSPKQAKIIRMHALYQNKMFDELKETTKFPIKPKKVHIYDVEVKTTEGIASLRLEASNQLQNKIQISDYYTLLKGNPLASISNNLVNL